MIIKHKGERREGRGRTGISEVTNFNPIIDTQPLN